MEKLVDEPWTFETLLAEVQATLAEAKSYAENRGIVLDLPEWLTVEAYCQRYDIEDPATVHSWVEQGLISNTDFRIVEELGNRLMMKAMPHDLPQPSNH